METVVVNTINNEDDNDRFIVLDKVIEDAGFWNNLEKWL